MGDKKRYISYIILGIIICLMGGFGFVMLEKDYMLWYSVISGIIIGWNVRRIKNL